MNNKQDAIQTAIKYLLTKAPRTRKYVVDKILDEGLCKSARSIDTAANTLQVQSILSNGSIHWTLQVEDTKVASSIESAPKTKAPEAKEVRQGNFFQFNSKTIDPDEDELESDFMFNLLQGK